MGPNLYLDVLRCICVKSLNVESLLSGNHGTAG